MSKEQFSPIVKEFVKKFMDQDMDEDDIKDTFESEWLLRLSMLG